MPEDNNNPPELILEEVIEVAPEELSDGQKTFLEENKGDLTDEQATKFGIEKGEEEEPIDTDAITPETRTEVKKPEPPKTEGDDVDPDDKEMVGKVVKEELGGIREDIRETKDQVEVDSYIRDNPEYSKYRAVALKFMKDPSYNNIPARNIMAMVASKDLQKIGAQKEREAIAKAKETQDRKSVV